MVAYYNEIDKYAAQWLRNLISENLIAPGDVDERDIRDVQPADVAGYTQCHFFAGIGGWSHALRLAGWPDTRPVWTGSCPCQPFSLAGSHSGHGDERHLWPAWASLIRKRKPAIIFGEQVARAIGFGWLDTVALDLEAEGYAFGAAVLPACAVSAPHKRDRLWFVANTDAGRLQGQRLKEHTEQQSAPRGFSDRCRAPGRGHREAVTKPCGEGLAFGEGPPGQRPHPAITGSDWWAIEPDVGRVAHGVSARVAKLRAFGNAIVPQVAAQFIKASM